jgi:hypothetical protein
MTEGNNDRRWSAEQVIQVVKESVTAILGLFIVVYTLAIGWRVFSYVGDQQKISDAKDILMLMLGLAGVVVGYYFGRVPADARSAQAQQQASDASAHAEQVSAEARVMADRIDQVIENAAPAGPAARGSGSSASEIPVGELQQIRDGLRSVAKR